MPREEIGEKEGMNGGQTERITDNRSSPRAGVGRRRPGTQSQEAFWTSVLNVANRNAVGVAISSTINTNSEIVSFLVVDAGEEIQEKTSV